MKNLIVVLLVLAIIGIGVYYFVPRNSLNGTPEYTLTPTTTESLNTSTPVVTGTSNTSVTVNIRSFSFDPSTITVKKGTKVTWLNNDSVSHTITSDSGSLLKSSILAPGQSFSFTFTNIGTVNYHCSIHTTMKASVVVTN